MHKRAYKYRFYPTEEQKQLLAQTFGCCRFVYNWGLSIRKTAYFQHGQSLDYNDLAAMLPALKEQYPWLRDASAVPLQQALRHLDRAFHPCQDECPFGDCLASPVAQRMQAQFGHDHQR